MSSATVTIRVHEQISMSERERRSPDCMNDRAYSTRKSGDYRTRGRHSGWENTTKARHNGGYHFFGPSWVLPKVIATVTASIVWGICGKMADVPEY